MKFRRIGPVVPKEKLITNKLYFIKCLNKPNLCYQGKARFLRMDGNYPAYTWAFPITSNPSYTHCLNKEINFSQDFMYYEISE